MENVIFNKCQTPLEELELGKYPQEVQDQFWEFINNVPFIKWMVSPDRPMISELPRDAEGKVIVDITKPPILENTDYFRQTAKQWQETGVYTPLRPNRNPNSDYMKWALAERERSWDGCIDPHTGMWITGDQYFFLNYCPIQLIRKDKTGKDNRVIDFPEFWDGHFLIAHYLQRAREEGKHASELASRGKGKSYFGASLLTKRFELGESKMVRKKVQCVVTAADRKYVYGANQILNMFCNNIDFVAINTQWASLRLVDSAQSLNWVSGYKDKYSGVRKGSGNSVMGITSGDDQSKLNGTRGVLYLIEEAGIFKNLMSLYQMIRPSVEDGSSVYGMIFMYGCVCAGTKVLDENGVERNIEDIKLGDKLLGHNGNEISTEDITYIQEEAYKECVRIITEKGEMLECSTDHPLLTLIHAADRKATHCAFYKANELKKGMTLLMPRTIAKFGNVHEEDAFLLGALFGDGSYSNNSCVSLSISTEEEYAYYNSRYDIGISKLSKGHNTYAQIYFKSLHPLLQKYGMDKQSFDNKHLPCNIDFWDKQSLCAFLSGYFTADGNIQIIKKKHRVIKLTCAYKSTLEQIKHLLHKLGITSHILEEKKPERVMHSNVNNQNYILKARSIFVLYIGTSKDIVTFRENMFFLIKKKQERLDSYIPSKREEGEYSSLKFVFRENQKGKYFIGKEFKDLKAVCIKKIEYIGKQRIYNLTANTTHTYITNGFISSNTAGDDMSDFTSLQEIMYNPRGYNMLPLPNVYDKEGQGRKEFTFFYPAYMNRANCMDENGNSDVTKALLEILWDRYNVKYNSTDINAITKRISQYPITPQEAIVRSHGSIFPVTELNNRLNQIDNNPNEFDDVYVGELVQNSKDGSIEFRPTPDTPIREFPTKDNKVKGAVEIYCMPKKNPDGRIPHGRYIAGADPFINDTADTMSLGSFFMLDTWTDTIVMEYTGRPMYADDYYEICRKACLFYNAQVLFESNKKGYFPYFSQKNSTHLLADTPEYLLEKQLIKGIGYGNTRKGVTTTLPIKNFGFTLIRDWLLKPTTKIVKNEEGVEEEITISNLYNLRCRALIKELVLYHPHLNVDRIMALCMLMIFREEKMVLYQGNMGDRDSGSSGMETDSYWNKNYPGKKSSWY